MFHLYHPVISTHCEQPLLTVRSQVCSSTWTAEEAAFPTRGPQISSAFLCGVLSFTTAAALSLCQRAVSRLLKPWKAESTWEYLPLAPSPAISKDQQKLECEDSSHHASDLGLQGYPQTELKGSWPLKPCLIHPYLASLYFSIPLLAFSMGAS